MSDLTGGSAPHDTELAGASSPQPAAGRVSVVIPVHNAARWVEDCIASFESQTAVAPDQVICIDDGSSDGSADILDELASRYPNLQVVHQPCRGVSAARNEGLARATGDYVLFADADDFVEPDLVEQTLPVADKLGADLVIFGFDEYWGSLGRGVAREMCEEPGLAGRAFGLEEMEGIATSLVTPNIWRVLWRRDFIERNRLKFPEELSSSEDLTFLYEALFSSPRLALVNRILYHYRRDGGGSTLTHADRGLTVYRALSLIRDYAQARGALDDKRVMRHYVNLVLDASDYAMRTAVSREEYDTLFRVFQSDWRPLVERHKRLVDDFCRPFWSAMRSMDEEEHLFELYGFMRDRADRADADLLARTPRMKAAGVGGGSGATGIASGASGGAPDDVSSEGEALLDAQAQIARLTRERDDLERELADVRASHSYRVGNALMKLPAAIKRRLRGQ